MNNHGQNTIGVALRKVDDALLMYHSALPCGIRTDKDVAMRVLGEALKPCSTLVSKVMTRNPIFVMTESLDVEAQAKMIEGKYRHLSVLENGEDRVIGAPQKLCYDTVIDCRSPRVLVSAYKRWLRPEILEGKIPMGCENSLSEEQIEELKEIITRLKLDSNGSLMQLELGFLLRSLGLKPSREQGLKIFTELKSLIDPTVKIEATNNQGQLMAQLHSLDKDGKGYFTAAELTRSMDKMGHPLHFRKLSEMIVEADTGGNGKINIVKFIVADTFALVDYLKAFLMRSTPSRTPNSETMAR